MSELPPLPAKPKSNAAYSPSASSVSEFPPLPKGSHLIANNDDVLQKHYLRLQEAILTEADKKVDEVQNQLFLAKNAVKISKEELVDSNVALYRTNKKVDHLSRLLQETQSQKDGLIGDRKMLEDVHVAIEREVRQEKKKLQKSEEYAKTVFNSLEEANLKIQHLLEINKSYESDVKIQQRINANLRKEINHNVNKSKSLSESLESEITKNHQHTSSKNQILELLEQQQAEVSTAKQAIETLHRENNRLEKSKAATEKQWEDSLTAMSGRDKAIQSIQDHSQAVATKLTEAEHSNRYFKTESIGVSAQLAKKETECRQLLKLNDHLSSELKNSTKNMEELSSSLSISESNGHKHEKEAELLRVTVEKKSREVEQNLLLIAKLKSDFIKANQDSNDQERIQIPLADVERREQKIQQEGERELVLFERKAEETNVTLRQQIASLKIQLSSSQTQHSELQKSYNSLKAQREDIGQHFGKLSDDAKQMSYSLERKEHDLNLASAKVAALESVHTESLNTTVLSLQHDIKKLAAEKDRLQSLWLQSQQELLDERKRMKDLGLENDSLQTKIGISEVVKGKAGKEIDNIKEEAFEQKQEAAKLYNQMRSMQTVIGELRDKNLEIEKKLHIAELKIQESDVNNNTTKHLLSSEIRKLSQDRSKLRQEKVLIGRATLGADRSTQIQKEMIDKLKSEKYQLQRDAFELKRRADEADRKYFDLKVKVRHMEKTEAKRQKERVGKATSQIALSSSNQALDAPEISNSIHISSEKILQDLPDFQAFRLKLDSLANEKEFLLNENNGLKDNLKTLKEKLENAVDLQREAKGHVKALNAQNHEQCSKITLLDMKFLRAKRVAAHMERQVKLAKPNSKIDYQMIENLEPSTQLLAAILSTDISVIAGIDTGLFERLQTDNQ